MKEETKTLAYRVASAIQTKLKDKLVWVRTQRFGTTGRLLFEYNLSEFGNAEACVAYSEGFFEETDAAHAKWLATTIYTQLTQSLRWQIEGTKHAKASDASDPHHGKRQKESNVSTTRVPQDRRNTRPNGQRRTRQSNAKAHPEFVHTETIPEGVI